MFNNLKNVNQGKSGRCLSCLWSSTINCGAMMTMMINDHEDDDDDEEKANDGSNEDTDENFYNNQKVFVFF